MFSLKTASFVALLAAAGALAIPEVPIEVDCSQCSGGFCYVVMTNDDGNTAPQTCSSAGGVLANLDKPSFDFVAFTVLPTQLPKFNSSRGFIESWDGNNYGETCIEMAAAVEGGQGSAYGGEDTCSKNYPAVCQFTLEGPFSKCAKCEDNCFAQTGKCFRIKNSAFSETEARAACAADGGKLWNGAGSAEFYWVNEFSKDKVATGAFADGYNGDSYEDACISFWVGRNAENGERGAMTATDCNGPLSAICEYQMSNKTERCPGPNQEIEGEELIEISNLAAKYPIQITINSSAASTAASAAGLLASAVAAIVALL